MITGVAFCPQAPLLLPGLAGAAAGELDGVRAACTDALRRVLWPEAASPAPTRVVLVCAARQELDVRTPAPDAVASLEVLGDPATVPLDPARPPGPAELPVAAGVGAFLLGLSGWTGDRAVVVLRAGLDPGSCAAAGRSMADQARALGPTALLVLGDGAACHGEKAPGYVDDAAGPFDDEVAVALAAADPAALGRLDQARADRLLVAGREAWQAAAGALVGEVEASPRRTGWSGEVLLREEPYGVGYLVATWLPDRTGRP